MKNKVRFSAYSKVITLIGTIVIVAAIVNLWNQPDHFALLIFFFALIVGSICCCPREVEATSSGVTLRTLVARYKVFTYDSISEVDTCYPTWSGIRMCGCGGFFGFWGYFSHTAIGSYYGFYGSRDSCFLLKLKNGRQYVIGCEDPHAMVDYIRSQMAR